jgi:glycosyltransferase involved in cell wall biosynthesis
MSLRESGSALQSVGRFRLLMLADAGSAHTISWVRSLAQRGHEIRVFTLRRPQPKAYEGLPGVSIAWQGVDDRVAGAPEGSVGKSRYLLALPRLRAEIRDWRPHLVHAHYASSYGLLATLAAARPRIVSVWGMDVFSFPGRSRLHRWLLRWILETADMVLSTSHVMRREVHAIVDRPVEVTPFGVDTERFRPRPPTSSPGPLRIGTVKTLEAKYGIEYLIRAFAIVVAQGGLPDRLRLVIAGGGSLRSELEALARELGVEADTEFLGMRPYSEVHEIHRSLDVALYPSIDSSESFGVAAVESQSCGVPVVVSDVGGLPEVVVDGLTGIVVPPRDPGALAAALRRLLLDPELRNRMGHAARDHAVRSFALGHCIDIMERCYATAIGDARIDPVQTR